MTYQNMTAERIAREYIKALKVEDYPVAEEAFEAGIALCGEQDWRDYTDAEIILDRLRNACAKGGGAISINPNMLGKIVRGEI